MLFLNHRDLTWWPKAPSRYWANNAAANSSLCHSLSQNPTVTDCAIENGTVPNPFHAVPAVGTFWETSIPPAPMGSSGSVESGLVLNSRRTGREAALLDAFGLAPSFCLTEEEMSEVFPYAKIQRPELRDHLK